MLKRTVSAIAIVICFSAALLLNGICPAATVTFFAFLAATATFEMLYNTGTIKSAAVSAVSSVVAAVIVELLAFASGYVFYVIVLYVVFVAVISLVLHKKADIKRITMLLSFPIILPVGFTCIYSVFDSFGIAYMLMLINFSAVCDVFAYLVGVTLGKHKLCPEISPKKTVEGAVGGIAGSLIITFVIALIFKFSAVNLIKSLILTPFMCAVGMVGDLFTSVIKRSVGIKDYGKIIPGHGGIMDRFDSILLIAPVFLSLTEVLK